MRGIMGRGGGGVGGDGGGMGAGGRGELGFDEEVGSELWMGVECSS